LIGGGRADSVAAEMRQTLAALLLVLAPGLIARAEDAPSSRGQTVYVPVYSHIWHGNRDGVGQPSMLLLSSMLSVRNTDPERAITLRAVSYYDGEGKKLRDEPAAARTLAPLQAAEFFVEYKDKTGGTGASFLVVWDAETAVSPPVAESVNAYFLGTQSVAFTSRGQAVRPGGR
jgi:hypothetical protein